MDVNIQLPSSRMIVAFGAALTLTLAACGGDDDSAADSAPATVAAAEPAAEAAPTDATISIADFAFSGVTEVKVGTTVTVTNDDGGTHTWTAVDDTFDSGNLSSGDSFEFTFTEAGSFDYFCNIHPGMTGTIVVTA